MSTQPPIVPPINTSPPPTPPAKAPIPAWAWIFAVACGIIPVLTLGGAIPAGIGLGGAGACIGVARNASMPLVTRVATCIAITVACWGGVILLLGGLAMLTRK
jgi:hypothetical protein